MRGKTKGHHPWCAKRVILAKRGDHKCSCNHKRLTANRDAPTKRACRPYLQAVPKTAMSSLISTLPLFSFFYAPYPLSRLLRLTCFPSFSQQIPSFDLHFCFLLCDSIFHSHSQVPPLPCSSLICLDVFLVLSMSRCSFIFHLLHCMLLR